MGQGHDPRRAPGWVLIGEAFLRAPRRTMTNVELGNVRGVQAFRSRISDLRRMGWPISEGTYIDRGLYAYTLEPGWFPPGGWRDGTPPPTPTAEIKQLAREQAAEWDLLDGRLFEPPPSPPASAID